MTFLDVLLVSAEVGWYFEDVPLLRNGWGGQEATETGICYVIPRYPFKRTVNSSGVFLYKLKSNNKGKKPFMWRFPQSWGYP